MLALLAGGWGFVFFYLISYSFELTYSSDIPRDFAPWLATHGMIALFALLGVTLLVYARLCASTESGSIASKVLARINNHHKTIGIFTAVCWLITQIWGFINLYILR